MNVDDYFFWRKTCERCGAEFLESKRKRGAPYKLCADCRAPRQLSADPVNVRRRANYARKRQRQIGGEG